MDLFQKSATLAADLKAAPAIYSPGDYWERYQEPLRQELNRLQIDRLRSGDYPILFTFGCGDTVYYCHPRERQPRRAIRKLLTALAEFAFVRKELPLLPYGIKLSQLRALAYNHAALFGERCGALPLSSIQASTWGSPADVWLKDGRAYTMSFLQMYMRYCSVHSALPFERNSIVVELGSGSGEQAIVLKKLYPDLTILCFDLPPPLVLAETYVAKALGQEVVGSLETREWKDLSRLQAGKVHFLGNWQFPLLENFNYDLFWNAASFGEMELEIVEHYLSIVRTGARAVYLNQAAGGKQEAGEAQTVHRVIRREDYQRLLRSFEELFNRDEDGPLGPAGEAGGYFEGVWARSSTA